MEGRSVAEPLLLSKLIFLVGRMGLLTVNEPLLLLPPSLLLSLLYVTTRYGINRRFARWSARDRS